ncbi:MAG: hypothetical protein E7629_09560 [Ruminococcaceae bacterium]|nr:hypothetical protein [Oscillospiraceae bacterium]
MTKDQTVLARCNLFGVFGAIPELLRIDDRARDLVKKHRISIGFLIKGGPTATLRFDKGEATLTEGCRGVTIKLYFSSAKKFNDMIDGNGMPIPISGFHRLGFLLKEFMQLTDILTAYLRPKEGALDDPEFLKKSTKLMLRVIAGAVVQIGNNDPVGKFSASNIVDGDILLKIGDIEEDGTAAAVNAKDHTLTLLGELPKTVFSEMQFADYETARALFDGKINAVAAVGTGRVRIKGMISQIDNVNRILDRVSIYLA